MRSVAKAGTLWKTVWLLDYTKRSSSRHINPSGFQRTSQLKSDTQRDSGAIFNILKENKNLQPRISYRAKLSILSEEEKRSFPDKEM